MILPGATLGMLGGGQLGRMFTVAARTMGYRVVVLDPDPVSPAGKIADRHLQADFLDPAALDEMSRTCAAITTEFENVPAQTLDILARSCFVRPPADAVRVTQDRINEKSFFTGNGFPTNRHAVICEADDLKEGLKAVGMPAVLKRSRLGYDGKGQWRVGSPDEAADAFQAMGGVPCVLEEFLEYRAEVSVVLARGVSGEVRAYPPGENRHVNGILDSTIVPARIPSGVSHEAVRLASSVAERMGYQGVMAVEFFLMPDDRLLINEIAPRPHNSGHYTLDACATSQFEQQVRTLCGLPPGDTSLLSPVVMKNILGDMWGPSAPRWEEVLQHAQAKLHLYGKAEPRKGRKMGHYSVLDRNVENALRMSQAIFERLRADAE